MTLIKSTSDVAYWRNFWLDKADPMHRAGDEAHYDFMASELMVLLGQRPFNSVLEIGCGTGSLYKRLGFDKTSYTGVDFSPSMLSTFKQKYPDTPVFARTELLTSPPSRWISSFPTG
jgi:ubiquinone/menaquinone biosynthesis C-methylase UbiE